MTYSLCNCETFSCTWAFYNFIINIFVSINSGVVLMDSNRFFMFFKLEVGSSNYCMLLFP